MGRPQPFSFPTHDSVEAERLYLKQRLAAGFRLFGRLGFDEGVAGHITFRDPEFNDSFWVNPFGMSFKHIRASDLIRVNHDGEVLEGDWPVNQAAFAIHSSVHKARPDILAAAHSHSKNGRALSALGVPIQVITQDACAFYNDHAVYDDFGGVVNDVDEGARIAAALGQNKCALLQNHGLLTVGQSVDSAVWWFITAERTCEVQLAAMAAGTPKVIPDDIAKITYETVGSEYAGMFQFHPLWSWIVDQEPDLLD
ncbi:MAG: class II aldolase/adducin family protein [Actinobacteria bacterium]|nr:class II aldolase/adducin family protein [Actinomycetota bacterium]